MIFKPADLHDSQIAAGRIATSQNLPADKPAASYRDSAQFLFSSKVGGNQPFSKLLSNCAERLLKRGYQALSYSYWPSEFFTRFNSPFRTMRPNFPVISLALILRAKFVSQGSR